MSSTGQPPIPQHVAIIMDGNGRWAKQRGLPRLEGHRRGVEAVRTAMNAAREIGIRYITLYAFSVENWKRPQDEVGGLMGLLELYLRKELSTFLRDEVRFRTIGRTASMPPGVLRLLRETEEATKHFTQWNFTLALNYGARTEAVDAVRSYAIAVREGRENPDEATWEKFAGHLYTADLPDPDLLIRTSGELRISNFLLLQLAYAEMVFTSTLWPDFSKADLQTAVDEYGRRERRYGLTSEQVRQNPA